MDIFFQREFFQLTLLKYLSSALNGRPYALKGGCCLRFCFNSPRMSEDIDLDIQQVAPSTLQKMVDRIWSNQYLLSSLQQSGITSIQPQPLERAKQTATTQRWKVTLQTEHGQLIHTKLEFSRRKTAKLLSTSSMLNGEVIRRHQILPFICQYYDLEQLLITKLDALRADNRNAVRDLFDIDLLLQLKPDCTIPDVPGIRAVINKIARFTYRNFQEQVFPYMEKDFQENYKKQSSFEQMSNRVTTWLLKELDA